MTNVTKARRVGPALGSILLTLAVAPPVAAQPATISLTFSERHVIFGKAVTFAGVVSAPAAAGQKVDLLNGSGAVVDSATVNRDGTFQMVWEPRKKTTLHAAWGDGSSRAVTVNVQPVVELVLKPAPLFGRARVVGTVRPVMAGERATVSLVRNDRRVATRTVTLPASPRFVTNLPVRAPGRHSARIVVDGSEHLAARARSTGFAPSLPSLSSGSRGRSVRMLERRLIDLGYYLPSADRIYDQKTFDAVIAFHKVQRTARVGSVDAATWRSLARPVIPKPRAARGSHIEVDQTRQVLFVVRRGSVRWILHTSTGAGGITRDGTWRVHGKLAGTSGGGLYYPSYFDGLRAIHGWPSVPTYPASHGCARVPMWSAQWIYTMTTIGTKVLVYH